MKKIFIGITILSMLLLVIIIVLYTSEITSCKPNQGISSIIIISIQAVLMIIAFIYSHKSKLPLKQAPYICDNNLSISEQLLLKENHQIKLKNLQINLVRFAFVIALVLQAMEIVVYYGGNPNQICNNPTEVIKIQAPIDLYILCL